MQNTNVPQGWNFSEFGTFAFLAKDKYEPDANEHKRCIELEHIEKETGKLISVSDSSTHTSVKNKFATNDVLFGKLRPYLKKYYKPDFEGVCSTEIWVLRGKQAILQEYLFLLIQSDKFISACNVSTGSRMPRADWSFVSETPFLLPPIEEQKKIAEILGTWDRAIEELTGLIAEKKELKRGLMQRLLTGAQRLPGFTKTWKNTKLGDVTHITTAVSKSQYIKETGPYLIVDMGAVSNEATLIAKKQTDYEGDFLICGDLIMPKDDIGGGNIIGKTVVVDCNNKYILGDHVFKIHVMGEYDAKFISNVINSFDVNKYMRRMSTGSAQLGLAKRDVEKCVLFVPTDLAEQKAIADVLSKADLEIDLLNQQLNVLKEQKRGLVQKLLTGEIRVKVDNE